MTSTSPLLPTHGTGPIRVQIRGALHRKRLVLGGVAAGLLATAIIGPLTIHAAPAPDADVVAHTVTVDSGSVVVRPGDALPAAVTAALQDRTQQFRTALQLERATSSHVLLVEPRDGAYVALDPLATGTGVVISGSAPYATLEDAKDFVAATPTAPDGVRWQVVDLTQ